MPPSEQERRCIDLACRYLGGRYGGSWSIEEFLDDFNPSEPSPEVIVGNSQKRAAIEVKRLTGDAMQQEYVASLLSNDKFLTPSCGGSYYLNPPVDFRLPMDTALRRLVKREIERLASTLSPGEKGAIRIPRQGHISLISESGPSLIYCLHQGPGADLVSGLKDKITGMFMLVDEGLEHSFVTQEGKAAFEEAVTIACERRLQGNTDPFSWDEEWELARIDDEDNGDTKNGVWIIAVTDARSMQDSVEQCVHAVLDKAMQKFRTKRWADLQIVVVETSALAPRLQAAQAVGTFEPDNRGLIDHFLLVDGEEIAEASAVVAAWLQEREADELRRRRHVIDSPISEARLQRFQEDYLKGRQEIGAAEKIFTRYGAFQYRSQQKETASFGFNRFVHKGPFVDGSNWADLRGWEFAVAEERHLLSKLHSQLAESASQTGQMLPDHIAREPSAILSAANRMSDLLASRGFRATPIVLATNLDTDVIVAFEKALTTPGWELTGDLRTNWILGLHGTCPVLYFREQDLNSLYVLDVPRFATLVQFDPLVELHVEAVDEARARRILEERRDLKLDMDTLRSMAHLRLYQSYEFEINDRSAVWEAKLSPD
jgi:hypothetical protein